VVWKIFFPVSHLTLTLKKLNQTQQKPYVYQKTPIPLCEMRPGNVRGPFWRQCLASRGAKEIFRGHIASDTLGKTLAKATPRGQFFLWGAAPPPPAGAGADCGQKQRRRYDCYGYGIFRVLERFWSWHLLHTSDTPPCCSYTLSQLMYLRVQCWARFCFRDVHLQLVSIPVKDNIVRR